MNDAPTASRSTPPTQSARAWIMWLLAVAGLLLQVTLQTTYSEVNPHVQSALRLSLTEVALAASIYNWTFAVAQMFSGTLLDRFDAHRSLTPPLVLVTLGAWLYATADSFGQLALSQVLLALGASVSFVGAGYVGGRWFGHAHYGLMFGAVQLAAGFASAGAQLLASHLLASYGWREVVWGYVLAAGTLALVFLLVFRDAPRSAPAVQPRPLRAELADCLRHGSGLWLAAAWGAIAFGLQLAMGVIWAPKLMAVQLGSTAATEFAAPATWLGVGLGSVALNLLSNRLRARKPVLVASYLAMIAAVGAIVLLAGLPAPAYVALFFVFGIANGVHMLAFTTAADLLPQQIIGTASAVINGSFFVMGGLLAAAPARLLAWFPDWAGSARPYWPFLALLVLGLVLVTFAQRETFPRNVAPR